jgi:hypothetical protein
MRDELTRCPDSSREDWTFVIFALLTWNIAQCRGDFWAATFEPRSYRRKQRELTQKATKDTKRGPTRRDRSNIAVARFLDMPRRIAQERVPTAFNVGSRDVTWTSRPTPLIPFRRFSRVSRAPFLRQSEVVTGTQFLIGLRVLCRSDPLDLASLDLFPSAIVHGRRR